MKRIYLPLLYLCIILFSCQSNDAELNADTGFLRLTIHENNNNSLNSRIVDSYNPKQIAVQVLDVNKKVVESTDDWKKWVETPIELKQGTYTINASSNGFDGSESGFDIPYYVGTKTVTIKPQINDVTVECTLANVKVTVNYDPDLIASFGVISTQVGALDGTSVCAPVNFGANETRSAYFPVTDLYAEILLINKSGKSYTKRSELTKVAAREHYILNYKLAPSGTGKFNVTVNEKNNEIEYTFVVSPIAKTGATVSHSAWSRFAILTASDITMASGDTMDDTKLKFEYKKSTDKDENVNWKSVAVQKEEKVYRTKITSLVAKTEYDYRLVYDNDILGEDKFTTDTEEPLYNGNLDDWYALTNSNIKRTKTWYAISESDYNNKRFGETQVFWDSSNPGTTQGVGATVNVNPTQGSTDIVHTAEGKSAMLKSQYASAVGIGKFAAASLYTGKFNSLEGSNGAKIDFGQPFTSRPTALHGWFQYSTGAMDYVGGNTPSGLGIVEGTTLDECSIYIALTTRTYQVNNTDTSTFVDWNNDPGVVAYGELPASECVATNGQWKEFTVPLVYHNLETRPSHIIIVISSSKYGDYFTGSTKSVMYVDDMELIYGDTPQTK